MTAFIVTPNLSQSWAHNGYTYLFNYIAGNPEDGVYQGEWEVKANHPMDAAWIERTWGQIAEFEEYHFVRGDIEVTYPHCSYFANQPF